MTEEEVSERKVRKAVISDSVSVQSRHFAKGHSQTVTGCALSFDDKWLASASKDGSVIQWDVSTQGMIAKFKPEGKGKSVRGVTFCGDSFGGNVLVSCGEDRLVRLWDVRVPGSCVKELAGHQGEVNAVRFAYDNSTNAGKLFTIGSDKAVKVWYTNGTEGKVFDSFYGHTSSVLCMDMMSLDRPITGGDDHAIRSWNLGRDSHSLFSNGGHTAPVDSVFMLDFNHYISSGQDGSICLWGSTSRKALAHVEDAHSGNWVTAVGGIRNSDLALSGSMDGSIKLWRVGRPTETPSKKTKMVLEELSDKSVSVEGVINEIVSSSCGKLVVAAIGKDHKHGRWITAPHAQNGLLFMRLTDDSM